MGIVRAALAAGFLVLAAGAAPAQTSQACSPSKGLNFVCGLNQPEDLIQVGTGKWIVASGMGSGGSISLIDADAKQAQRLYTGAKGQIRFDRKTFPECAGAPDIGQFNTHGLALRPSGTGIYRLYAVTHLPYESIQVFTLDARGPRPRIAWIGCVPLPKDFRTNAVTALKDGTILANVQMRGRTTNADFINGRITGGVYAWKPGGRGLKLLAGTELAGNNGIELSPDEKELYIAVSGTQTVVIYRLADTRKPDRQIRTPWYNLDNIHWSGNRLIAAGMMYDEPACGGTRAQILAAHLDLNCHRGWVVSQLDPRAMTWKILAYGEPNPAFGGIATGLVIGRTLWLSSFQEAKAAYLPLPEPKKK
jgi:hypothetical protein